MTPETKEIREATEENITELVEFKKTTVLAAFSSKEGLDSVVSDTVALVQSFEHDMSTGASRARTASLASKVAKLKVRLDGLGKDLVADWKTKAKTVDSSRKRMRDDLDALKIEARKPLTDWENEEAAKAEAQRAEAERLEAERHKKELADKLAADIESGHELGLLLNAEHDRKIKEANDLRIWNEEQDAKEQAAREEAKAKLDAENAAKAEAERVEREKQLAEKAAEDARLEAEEKARLEAEKVEQENQRVIKMAQDARDAKEQAERDKIAAQERAKVQAEQAEKARIAAKEQAERDAIEAAENAKKAEQQRQADEAARIENDKRIREEDLKHASEIMRQAKETLMQFAAIDEETAKRVVIAIKNENVKNVSIQF